MASAIAFQALRSGLLACSLLVLGSALDATAQDIPPATQPSSQSAKVDQPLARSGPFAGKPVTPIRRFTSAEQFVVFIDGKSKVVQLAGLSISGNDADRDAAKQFVETLLTGEQVHIELAEKQISKDGALVMGYMYRSPDGLFINEELIRQGYARVDEKYDGEFLEQFLQYEHRAKELKRGIWNAAHGDKNKASAAAKPAVAPAGGDKKSSEPASGGAIVYITDSGKKYHRQSCQWAKTGKPMALEEAKRMYEPCKVCKPPE